MSKVYCLPWSKWLTHLNLAALFHCWQAEMNWCWYPFSPRSEWGLKRWAGESWSANQPWYFVSLYTKTDHHFHELFQIKQGSQQDYSQPIREKLLPKTQLLIHNFSSDNQLSDLLGKLISKCKGLDWMSTPQPAFCTFPSTTSENTTSSQPPLSIFSSVSLSLSQTRTGQWRNF